MGGIRGLYGPENSWWKETQQRASEVKGFLLLRTVRGMISWLTLREKERRTHVC